MEEGLRCVQCHKKKQEPLTMQSTLPFMAECSPDGL